jgi:hypothetical protein
MRYVPRFAAVTFAAAVIIAVSLQVSPATSTHLSSMEQSASAALDYRTIIFRTGTRGTGGSHSRLATLAVSGDGAAADVDAVPAPYAFLQWFVSLLAIWLVGFSRSAKTQNHKAANQVDSGDSQKRLELVSLDPSHVSASASRAYCDVIEGYERLKGGRASTLQVDELRQQARSLLSGRDEQALYELREVRTLLDWLDNARIHGRITITVQQLRVRKMGKWEMECGIAAGAKTAKVKMAVAGNLDVVNCSVKVPWDPSSSVKLWMRLLDIGYETCCGHFGPISMSSAEVLQDGSGLLRGFHAEQFDKDFKVAFAMTRNFDVMPSLRPIGIAG